MKTFSVDGLLNLLVGMATLEVNGQYVVLHLLVANVTGVHAHLIDVVRHDDPVAAVAIVHVILLCVTLPLNRLLLYRLTVRNKAVVI